MLVDVVNQWWYMEIPRTGSSTLDRAFLRSFPHAKSVYGKHWPILPTPFLHPYDRNVLGIVSVRDPFSRAVSCWQFFTAPGQISFAGWLEERKANGFTDVFIEAQPQSLWLKLHSWEFVIQQESLEHDFWKIVQRINPNLSRHPLERFNDINGPWVNRVRVKHPRDKPWQDYYCDDSTKLVLEVYAEDFKTLSRYYGKTVRRP